MIRKKGYKKKIINWSEVSRQLTNDRYKIRSEYSDGKYSDIVEQIKELEKSINLIIYKSNN